MGRHQRDSYSVQGKIPKEDRQRLEQVVIALGFRHGGGAAYGAFFSAIARGEIRLEKVEKKG